MIDPAPYEISRLQNFGLITGVRINEFQSFHIQCFQHDRSSCSSEEVRNSRRKCSNQWDAAIFPLSYSILVITALKSIKKLTAVNDVKGVGRSEVFKDARCLGKCGTRQYRALRPASCVWMRRQMPWMIVGVIIKAGQACLHCIIVSRVHVVVYIA